MKPVALVAAALVLAACGNGTQTATSTVTSTAIVTVQQPTVTKTVTYTPPPPPPPDTSSDTGGTYKTVIEIDGTAKTVIDIDGTYLVGPDIPPGRYRTPGGAECYWARLTSLDASDRIDYRRSTGPQFVEISRSDTAFLTQNCRTWQMI